MTITGSDSDVTQTGTQTGGSPPRNIPCVYVILPSVSLGVAFAIRANKLLIHPT